MMLDRKQKVFFAIPCGDFYSIESKIIGDVSKSAHVEPIIIENHARTKELWKKIKEKIDSADFFMADISSWSPNVALELGYTMNAKPIERMGIFIAESAKTPVDLQGFVLQKYSSFYDFQDKLIRWLCELIPSLNRSHFKKLRIKKELFYDHFKDRDIFLRQWYFPPGSFYLLTHEGLQFTNAHLPIMTTSLGLLGDCEFEFCARINQRRIGWVVKGTKFPDRFIPAFCVMFNLDNNGNLVPHIWNENHINQQTQYNPFLGQKVTIKKTKGGWFTLITRIHGDTINISNEGKVVFKADFRKEPYGPIYNCFPNKQGQVGFRCYPEEEGTIKYVHVREL